MADADSADQWCLLTTKTTNDMGKKEGKNTKLD